MRHTAPRPRQTAHRSLTASVNQQMDSSLELVEVLNHRDGARSGTTVVGQLNDLQVRLTYTIENQERLSAARACRFGVDETAPARRGYVRGQWNIVSFQHRVIPPGGCNHRRKSL